MLDPVIDYIKWLFATILSACRALVAGVVGFFRFVFCALTFRSPNPAAPLTIGAKLRRSVIGLVLVTLLGWYGHYFWEAGFIRGFDYEYPNQIVKQTTFSPGNETTAPESGTAGIKSCGRSQVVDMEVYLIRFLTIQNQWIPSLPQHKAGIFGMVDWDDTPFFDRKSMFQKGAMTAVRRMAIELVDTLGRVRGTSGADKDLEQARGLVQFDMETWWFNPFSNRPFGPITPSDRVYRQAIGPLLAYNGRLEKCQALFDARRDNLYQVFDRISKDLGSTVDSLSRRSRAMRYDPKANKFVTGEGNQFGFFDLKADGIFWRALGEAYAYHGLLQALAEDFASVRSNFRLEEAWDQTEAHMAEAIVLWPWVVSNGAEDGIIMPAHLTSLAQRILRVRSNIVEMRDILNR